MMAVDVIIRFQHRFYVFFFFLIVILISFESSFSVVSQCIDLSELSSVVFFFFVSFFLFLSSSTLRCRFAQTLWRFITSVCEYHMNMNKTS